MNYMRNNQNGTECPADEVETLYTKGRKPGEYVVWGYIFPFDDKPTEDEDVESFTMYVFHGNEYPDLADVELAVNAAFSDLVEEMGLDFRGDRPAVREAFNNWLDSENKDGQACDDTASEVAISDDLERELTR